MSTKAKIAVGGGKSFCLYILSDPRNFETRYVGQTCRKPAARFRRHMKEAETSTKHKLYAWIRQLVKAGMKPIFTVVATDLSQDEVNEYESVSIREFRRFGRILNRADGGASNAGWNHTEEQKQKWRTERRGENAPRWGSPQTEYTKERLREGVAKMNAEGRHPRLGKKWDKDTLLQMSKKRKGKALFCPEKARERMKLLWKDPEFRQKAIEARRKAASARALTDDEIRGIYLDSLRDDMMIKDVASKYNVSTSRVRSVRNRKGPYQKALSSLEISS